MVIMEIAQINEFNELPKKTTIRLKAPNSKKNYQKGPRRKVTQLTLYSGLLPFKGLTLLEGNYKTLCKKIDEMRTDEEGVLEKRKECGIWVIGFKSYSYDSLIKEITSTNFDKKLIDHYEEIGKADWRRAKSKVETDVLRVVRNSETIMFMDRLNVAYMPGEKTPLRYNNPLPKNSYYTSRELQLSSTAQTDQAQSFEFRGSRNNGFLMTDGGNYLIYNFSDWTLQVDSGYEVRLHNYVENLLVQEASNLTSTPIILYRNQRVLNDLIEPAYRKQQEWISNLEQPYGNVYALSLDQTGQKLCQIMCSHGWVENLKKMLLPKNVSYPNLNYITNDGVYVDGTSNKEKILFLFCIPDIKRLRQFLAAAKAIDDKEQFEIRCFDFQAEYLKPLAEKYACINIAPFDKVHQRYFEIFH